MAIDVDGRLRSPRVIEVLSRLVSERGAPAFLRSDNGPEFVSRAMLRWIVEQGRSHPARRVLALMIPTLSSSVSLYARIAPSIQGASPPGLPWAENPGAGRHRRPDAGVGAVAVGAAVILLLENLADRI